MSGKAQKQKPSKKAETSSPSPQQLVGKTLPKFKLSSSTGETIDSSKLKNGTIVIYFYPKADTPGCTKQACGFSDAIADYQELKVPVFGISPDPLEAVQKFAAKFNVQFPLLADPDHSVCEAFGVWQEKSMYGKKYWGAARTTFIVKDGKVSHVFEKVKPEGHDQEVLQFLKNS